MQKTGTGALQLQLNGASVSIERGATLGELIDSRGIVRTMIAVEYNGEILPRHQYDETVLNEGDQLEIVQMVGGG
jgi:sulfur carrier protein